jgi:surface polysaccharide O-acyltransferase-like enzyme
MRNHGLDIGRGIAAVSIVFLHTFNQRDIPYDIGEIGVAMMRWAVPFFFIVSGYLMNRAGAFEVSRAQIVKMLRLFLTACLIFLPYFVIFGGWRRAGIDTLFLGTAHHLWFLTALPLGLVVLTAMQAHRHRALATVLSIVLLAAYVYAAWLAAAEPRQHGTLLAVTRHLSAIPFLWLGWMMRAHGTPPAWPLMLVGVAMTYIEGATGQDGFASREIYTGSALFAVGFFAWVSRLSVAHSPLVDALSGLSLTVYILHPLFIPVGRQVGYAAFPIVLLMTLGLATLLMVKLPTAFRMVSR